MSVSAARVSVLLSSSSSCLVRHFSTVHRIPPRLTGVSLSTALQSVPHWQKDASKDSISRSFEFQDFNQTWSLMSRVALLAEKVRNTGRTDGRTDGRTNSQTNTHQTREEIVMHMNRIHINT